MLEVQTERIQLLTSLSLSPFLGELWVVNQILTNVLLIQSITIKYRPQGVLEYFRMLPRSRCDGGKTASSASCSWWSLTRMVFFPFFQDSM